MAPLASMPLVGTAHDRLCSVEGPCQRLAHPTILTIISTAEGPHRASRCGQFVRAPRHVRA